MVSQILLQKSSANYLVRVEFSQKGFDISIFGHRSCPFSENFLTLVQIRIEEITNLIYVIIVYLWEHNGHIKYWSKKSDFLGPKKSDMWRAFDPKLPILVLKRK